MFKIFMFTFEILVRVKSLQVFIKSASCFHLPEAEWFICAPLGHRAVFSTGVFVHLLDIIPDCRLHVQKQVFVQYKHNI